MKWILSDQMDWHQHISSVCNYPRNAHPRRRWHVGKKNIKLWQILEDWHSNQVSCKPWQWGRFFFPYRVVSVKRAARLRSGLSVVKYFHFQSGGRGGGGGGGGDGGGSFHINRFRRCLLMFEELVTNLLQSSGSALTLHTVVWSIALGKHKDNESVQPTMIISAWDLAWVTGDLHNVWFISLNYYYSLMKSSWPRVLQCAATEKKNEQKCTEDVSRFWRGF